MSTLEPISSQIFFNQKSSVFDDLVFDAPHSPTIHEMIDTWELYHDNRYKKGYKEMVAQGHRFTLKHWAFLYVSRYYDSKKMSLFVNVFGKHMPDWVALRFVKRELDLFREETRRDVKTLSEKDKKMIVSSHIKSRAFQMSNKPQAGEYVLHLLTLMEKFNVALRLVGYGNSEDVIRLGSLNYKRQHSCILDVAVTAQKIDLDVIDYLINRTTPSKRSSFVLVKLCERPRDKLFYVMLEKLLPFTDPSQAMQVHAQKSLSALIPYLSPKAWKKIKHMKCYYNTTEHDKRSLQDALKDQALNKSTRTSKM